MNDENMNKSAFPFPLPGGISEHQVIEFGLSKLEYFAGLAMHGLLANPSIGILTPDQYASDSVLFAKALINQLNNQQEIQ